MENELTWIDQKRSPDTIYKIIWNQSTKSFTLQQVGKKSGNVISKGQIDLSKTASVLKYNRNCKVVSLVPDGSVVGFQFDRAQLQNWIATNSIRL